MVERLVYLTELNTSKNITTCWHNFIILFLRRVLLIQYPFFMFIKCGQQWLNQK